MRSNRHLLVTSLAAGLTLLAAVARAGGPLFINEKSGTPLVYGPGTVPVYYDQGDLARIPDNSTSPPGQVVLGNAVGRHLVEKGFADWSRVPSSSFRATVVGDFSQLGLADVDGGTAAAIIGKWNGGGIFVIFDADGTVMQNFFGVDSRRARHLVARVGRRRHGDRDGELDGLERPSDRSARRRRRTVSGHRHPRVRARARAWRTRRPTGRPISTATTESRSGR